MRKRRSTFISIIVVGIFLMSGCSTKKNTMMSRNYHNLTAHYNVYFNALEIFNEGKKKVSTNYPYDFNLILPINFYGDKDVARRLLADMNKTIGKCSKVITLHSIVSRPKRKKGNLSERQKEFNRKGEYIKWIDDSYLLMGQAYYLKHDFFPAIQNFEYVIRTYPEDGLKYHASVWLAKCHIALKAYTEAMEILGRLDGDPEFPEELKGDLLETFADYYLEQNQIDDAINYLSKAISYIQKKDDLRRFNYILAQLFEEQEDYAQASLKYEEVINLNPEYRMAFNAKISRARLFEGDPEKGKEIRKQLQRMLKDDKNLEFWDQIYFAIGELDMKEGLVESALKNYKLSAQSTIDNYHQQAQAYLALASYYYDEPEYINAGIYYDSCMTVMPDGFPDQDHIMKFGLSVTLLKDNLKMIAREDSLQGVAKLSEEERDKLIDEKIAEATKIKEELERLEEEERLNNSRGGSNMQRLGGGGRPGMGGGRPGMGGAQMRGAGSMGGMSNPIGGGNNKSYFYNQSTLSFGQTEFAKRWGRRKLEDNWRRSNKKIASAAGDMSEEGEEGDIEVATSVSRNAGLDPLTKEYYMADLPMNDTLLAESHGRIETGYFNVAKVFKDELAKQDEAIDYFNGLLDRYPGTEKKLFVYYNLYQIYDQRKDTDRMQHYKDLILTEFPESRSALILKNPNYFVELEQARQQVNAYYKETYTAFKDGRYSDVRSNAKNADTAFMLNPIRDKFAILDVMSMAALEPDNKEGLTNQLNDVIFKFSESDVIEPAKLMLDYLTEGPKAETTAKSLSGLSIGEVEGDLIVEDASYQPGMLSAHMYVIVVSKRSQDLSRLTFNISNFNISNYDQDFFEVASVPLNDDLMLITVKNFDNAKDAMDYYYGLQNDPTVFEDFNTTDFRQFVISRSNYNLFYKNQNVFNYIRFFRENYLDKTDN